MEKNFLNLLFSIMTVFFVDVAHAQNYPEVKIAFKYNRTGMKVELYNVSKEYFFSISKTGVTKNLEKLPIAERLSDHFHLDKDGEKTFVMLVRNETDKVKYFTAVPHTVEPAEASLGVIFECLCNHHVYEIPPRTIWYRIVHLELPKEQQETVKGIKEIILTHQFIEISEKDAETKYKKIIYNLNDGPGK